MTRRVRRISAAFTLGVAIATVVMLARSAGPALIHIDPLAHGDAIIILGAMRIARTLEAGQLYREGWAPRIVVLRTHEPFTRGPLQDLRITLPAYFDMQVSALRQMGVPANAIIEVRESMESTEGEARQMASVVSRNRWRRIIVVTSVYHTRRAGWYFRAFARGTPIVMRSTRFDGADPARWWQLPYDRIDVLSEWVKWPKAISITMRLRLSGLP